MRLNLINKIIIKLIEKKKEKRGLRKMNEETMKNQGRIFSYMYFCIVIHIYNWVVEYF